MQYQTHIPTTSHAARESAFREQRALARESLRTQKTVQTTLIAACHGLLERNYLDVNPIQAMGKMIVRTSTTIRKLAPIAHQPDPPRHEPATPEENQTENRTYAGVSAKRIVRVLAFLRALKKCQGELSLAKRVKRLSDKLVFGLDVYRRVKALIADLANAVDAPETAMTPRKETRSNPSRERRPMPSFRWDTSPHEVYGWTRTRMTKGYDPRQTSVYWLEHQAVALKRAVYRQHFGVIKVKKPHTRQVRPDPQVTEIKTFIPPKGATLTDQIWPPIDLVRMIEARREYTKNTCHSGQTKREPEPRENRVHLSEQPPENVSGSRITVFASQHMSGVTSGDELEVKLARSPPNNP